MPNSDLIERALRSQLPHASSEQVQRLAKLLTGASDASTSSDGVAQLTVDANLAPLLNELADQQLEVDGGSVTFGSLVQIGSGVQLGDVIFRDIAGRDIVTVNITSQPARVFWQLWLLIGLGVASLALIAAVGLRLSAQTGAAPIATSAPAAPSWADGLLWRQLPQDAVVGLSWPVCADTSQSTPVPTELLERSGLGGTRVAIRDLSPEDLAAVTDLWVSVERRCDPGGSTARLTVIFHGNTRPIPLMNEPAQLQVTLPLSQTGRVAQAAVLYSLGDSTSARATLKDLMRTQDARTAGDDLWWFWGNILLREEDWVGSREAYDQALRDPATMPMARQADLLANRALARYLPGMLGGGGGDSELCSGPGRNDLEAALGLDERADFYVLLGKIALDCPRDDADAEQLARVEAERALSKDSHNALAHALVAELGNRLAGSDLIAIEQSACAALALTPDSPAGLRELGQLLANVGRAEDARTLFERYGQHAVFHWQQRDALARWRAAENIQLTDAPPSLGTVCPERWRADRDGLP